VNYYIDQHLNKNMSSITLTFDGVEEIVEALDALNGYKWKLIVSDIDQLLRETTKHDIFDGRKSTEEEYQMADRLREKIREIINDYNLNIE
jgi:hypothetical protein